MLPMGRSAVPSQHQLEFYCPRCHDIYVPPSRRYSRLDGVGFGPTFPHLLLMQYRDQLVVPKEALPVYEPRIFGFGIHPSSAVAPQAMHLRDTRPVFY